MSERILLHLDEHCIQTAARHEHARLLKELIESDSGDASAEERLQILTEFLEQSDFRALRAEHPELRDGSGSCVEVGRTSSGAVGWSLTGRSS